MRSQYGHAARILSGNIPETTIVLAEQIRRQNGSPLIGFHTAAYLVQAGHSELLIELRFIVLQILEIVNEMRLAKQWAWLIGVGRRSMGRLSAPVIF